MHDHKKHQAPPDESAIAIVGMSCRFPGAISIHQYWQNLLSSIESIHVESDVNGQIRARAELPGIEDFDYNFFGFSYKEAQLLDPQHRVLLECAWEVLEDASLHSQADSIGVFCGAGPSSYFINNVHGLHAHDSACGLYQSSETLAQFMATDKEFLASRIAYKLNCCGPAVNVQAACATSIFGIQAAIQALLLGECSAALVGTASISVPQSIPYYFEPGMPFSADGHCRPFDSKASGTVFGSGGAVVALKRLGDALADGNKVHAVIRSVVTNNDGAQRAGMSAPSVAGQARVIRDALDIAGVGAEQVSYIEAHGTATPIGDPIEIKALADAFANRDCKQTCYLGSVKGNIGHLGWAAGMASLIKAVLITKHRIIPPTLNFEQYNPELHIEETPFVINQQCVAIPEPHVIVGVSSFGLGGNNSHLIVETAPPQQLAAPSLEPEGLCLIPISARAGNGLQQLCSYYRQFLETLADDCFSTFVVNLRYSRSLFEQRTFVIAGHRRETIGALADLSFDTRPTTNGTPKIGLMFSGQGGEHRNMGLELYRHEALFKTELDAFDPVCLEVFGATAARLLFDPQINGRIEQDIALSQPMTFILQVAMARLFLRDSTSPLIFFGHSLGEYAAACIAGVFSPEQGFRMLVKRSQLLDSLGDIGAMVVLECDQQSTLKLLDKAGANLSIAALNSACSTVISGTLLAIEQLVEIAVAAGLNVTRLKISRPGHSSLLDPLLDSFEAYLDSIELSSPTRPLISCVTGKLATTEVATAQYWRRQMRETVNFRASVTAAVDQGCTHLVEIGPKATLSGLLSNDAEERLSVLSMARGNREGYRQYLTVLGELFRAGADVHFTAKDQLTPVLEGLPTYPFQRIRCWIDALGPVHTMADLIYQTVWQPLTVEHLDSRSTASQKVLFLTPTEHLNDAEIDYLRKLFEQFHCVALNRLIGETVNIAAQDFQALWKKCYGSVDRIYLDLRQPQNNDVTTAVSTCSLVLNLLHSVAVYFERRPQICLLFASAVDRDEKNMDLNPVPNSVVGMLRSVLIEEPNVKVTVLNFIREQSPEGIEESSPIHLLPLTDEFIVSVRQTQTFVPRLERAVINDTSGFTYPDDQTYILLGGAGGIGRQLIENLCSDRNLSIHVIGRTTRPNKALSELMVRRPTIRYLGIDLTTSQGRDDCTEWLQSAAIRKAAIFNLAVDLNDKLYGETQAQDLEYSFQSKCTSVLTLYQLLCKNGTAIDFIFNFSSATSILGNGGQSTYGAASAFLDAAHHSLFPKAGKILTVNWGIWGDAGKLSDDWQRLQTLEASGLNSHSSEQGLLFIRQLLTGPSRVAAFMAINEKALSDRSQVRGRFLEHLTTHEKNGGRARDASVSAHLLECANKTQMASVLATWLTSTISALVGLEASALGRYDLIKTADLKLLGFDSLAAVQLKNALFTQLGMQWTVKRLYAMQALSELHTALILHVSTSAWREAYGKLSDSADGKMQDIPVSLQQTRWISLIGKNYGLRIIPYLIHCPFDADNCRTALSQVVDEHRLLRTFFPDGRPTIRTTAQIVANFGPLCTDLSSQTATGKAQQITSRIQAMAQALPSPEEDVTWAIHFLDVGEPFFIALLGVQHLEFDGKSLTLLFERLGECLYCLTHHKPLTRVECALDYVDYARRQQQYLTQQRAVDAVFFKGLYNAFESPTVLPGHPGFSSTTAYSSSRHSFEVIGANRALTELAERHGFSVFNAILYVYAATMADIIDCDQLIISAINSGRGLSEFNNVIGPFTSPLPVPITVHHEWLSGISMVARTLEAVQDYPLMHPAMLIEEVPVFSGMAHDTYFSDLGINFLNYRHTTEAPGKVRIEGVEILGPVSEGLLSGANVEDMRRVPGLHLVVEINGDDLRFNFWFHSHRFATSEVAGWGASLAFHLEQLLSIARATNE